MKHTVLITGASSGIGEGFAGLIAGEGHNLVLVARSEDKLQEMAVRLTGQYGIEVTVIVKDLADPNAPEQLFKEVMAQGKRIDVLINNAGVGLYGPFAAADAGQELRMIDVNIRSLTHLTRLFLPGMIERGEGGILNVASTAAFQPGPLMAVYYATKAYVLSFTEALDNELRGSGVTVTALCPGPTDTNFFKSANMTITKRYQWASMNTMAVVECGWKGFKQKKTLVIPGTLNRLLAFTVRFIPRRWVPTIVRRIQEEKV